MSDHKMEISQGEKPLLKYLKKYGPFKDLDKEVAVMIEGIDFIKFGKTFKRYDTI
jgi:hypothetical protein